MPLQLYASGILNSMNFDHTATQGVFNSNDIVLYAFDGEGLLPIEDEDNQVSVLPVSVTLTGL